MGCYFQSVIHSVYIWKYYITDLDMIAFEQDDVDRFINSTSKYVNLPKIDGESLTYQFFKDKSKRKLVTKTFTDPITNQQKVPTTRVEYNVIDPNQTDQGEKLLDVPKSLAQTIEANVEKDHYLLEITRHGLGTNTRYTVIAA
jgi:hypothetical protein